MKKKNDWDGTYASAFADGYEKGIQNLQERDRIAREEERERWQEAISENISETLEYVKERNNLKRAELIGDRRLDDLHKDFVGMGAMLVLMIFVCFCIFIVVSLLEVVSVI